MAIDTKRKRHPGRPPASGYTGVYIVKRTGLVRYRAMIWQGKRGVSLGLFKCPELAAAAIARERGDEVEARRLEAKAGVYDPTSVTRRATPAEIAYARGYRPGSNDKEAF